MTVNRTVIKSVAMPAEHGSWGFLIEPILLGLFVAGTWAGGLLALAAFGGFLIHQPLKIAIKDRRKGRRSSRTIRAEQFVVGYGLLAVIPLIILLLTASPDFLLPLLLAVPFALVQLAYDSRNQSRRLMPEICGALALAMIAPAIAVLGGWQILTALILWLILIARAVTAILYVRARLKLERGKPATPYPVWLGHGVAFTVVGGLAVEGAMSYWVALPFAILLVRGVVGLSRWRKPQPAKVIGFQELGYGLFTVILVGLGFSI